MSSRVFQIASRGRGEFLPIRVIRKFYLEIFLLLLLIGWYLKSSNFDSSNLLQSEKQHSVNIEHQLKSNHDLCIKRVWIYNENGTGTMTAAQNEVFIGL